MECASPVALRTVQRHVGILEQNIRLLAIRRSKGYADAHADYDLMAFDDVRLAEALDNAPGRCGNTFGLSSGLLNDRELIPAKARYDVFLT
jgi:hypothetical protein